MAIPKQLGVGSESEKFRLLHLGISMVCLILFITCLKMLLWTEEGIVPYLWHEFRHEILVFTITLLAMVIGMGIFESYRSDTLTIVNEEKLVNPSGIQSGKQVKGKSWLQSVLCIGSSPDDLHEPETEAIRVEDLKKAIP